MKGIVAAAPSPHTMEEYGQAAGCRAQLTARGPHPGLGSPGTRPYMEAATVVISGSRLCRMLKPLEPGAEI